MIPDDVREAIELTLDGYGGVIEMETIRKWYDSQPTMPHWMVDFMEMSETIDFSQVLTCIDAYEDVLPDLSYSECKEIHEIAYSVPASVDNQMLFVQLIWQERMARAIVSLKKQLPAMPQAPWEDAPEKAQWWAVDADGTCTYFEIEPFVELVYAEWCCDITGDEWDCGHIDLQLGIDWRITLQQLAEA